VVDHFGNGFVVEQFGHRLSPVRSGGMAHQFPAKKHHTRRGCAMQEAFKTKWSWDICAAIFAASS
jgi:hypothetical protein